MDNSRWPAKAVLPIAVPGIKYCAGSFLAAGIFFFMGWEILSALVFLFCLFACWFFRDPDRRVPEEQGAMVSPADGRVIFAGLWPQNEYLDGPCIKISIFMNVFNVHVNRMPFGGTVEKVIYSPGRFINASFDKASVDNERNALLVRTKENIRYVVVQIAGLVARRIVNHAREKETIDTGRRYGMIQFGSRLDLYLPEDFTARVSPGDRVRAGETIVGFLNTADNPVSPQG